MKVYRVEEPKGKHGLWRDFDGKHNPIFDKLSEGKVRNLPMDDNFEIYKQNNKDWFASAPSKETLQHWFSKQDLIELERLNYKIFEFEIKNSIKLSDFEIIFTRDNIINTKELQISDIY